MSEKQVERNFCFVGWIFLNSLSSLVLVHLIHSYLHVLICKLTNAMLVFFSFFFVIKLSLHVHLIGLGFIYRSIFFLKICINKWKYPFFSKFQNKNVTKKENKKNDRKNLFKINLLNKSCVCVHCSINL